MPIAKITGQGLAVIGCSVALLWGCVIGNRILTQRAFDERTQVLREVRLMQRRPQTVPVLDRSPLVPHKLHTTAG